MKQVILLFFAIIVVTDNFGQIETGGLEGHVVDRVTGQPIEGAHVELIPGTQGTVTNADGSFLFETLDPGRYTLRISHTSYKNLLTEFLLDELDIAVREFSLDPATVMLEEVHVEDRVYFAGENMIGGKSVSIEQTNRIPANFFDPLRMLTSFPGIMASNDQGNNLIVRGNSPNTIQWKLEGLDIVNPNHQANAGTLSDLPAQNGGGVNILSAQLLDRTSIHQAPGTALLGNGVNVMNMHFRDGEQSQKYMGKISLIGMEAAAEGGNDRSSYIANYRYSTVGILTGPLGIDFGGEEISFQDLSFKARRKLNTGSLRIFGFGGTGYNRFRTEEEPMEEKDLYDIDYRGQTGGLGARYTGQGNVELGIAISTTDQYRESAGKSGTIKSGISNNFGHQLTVLSGLARKSSTLTNDLHLSYGIDFNFRSARFSSSGLDYADNGEFTLQILQPYAELKKLFGDKVLLTAGFRAWTEMQYRHFISEPRLTLQYLPDIRKSYSLSIGQYASPLTHLTRLSHPDNRDLAPYVIRSVEAEAEQQIGENMMLSTTVYGYYGYDVPVSEDFPILSVFNFLDDVPEGPYISQGESRNYGVELSLERRMADNFYGMAGATVYRSEYSDGTQWYQSRFNGGYGVTFLGGYERFYLDKTRKKKLNLNIRLLQLGGMQAFPLDIGASAVSGETIYDMSNGYTVDMADYFRVDFSVSYTWIRPGRTSVLSLDLQNLTGNENPSHYYWDSYLQERTLKQQLGLIPVLAYTITF